MGDAAASGSGPRANDRSLRISVIVTNYNYGHFLKACLGSLSAQMRAPDEIVVVDDGSDDGSRAFLAGLEGVRVILQPNRGQAAAFNAGFAASTGDALLFLDADDQLAPAAIAVIAQVWSDGVAGLSYDLETIDIAGRPSGRYPMRGQPGDARFRVLKDLAVDFMPTSGNVFARRAIAWAFPLPEARWRISADALLVRAAMLNGPLRHLPQTLGRYRMHGHNSYFTDAMPALWQRRRGSMDIAETGAALVEAIDRAGDGPELAAGRWHLLCAAARRRVIADRNGEPRGPMVAFLARLARLAARKGDFRLAGLMWLSAIALPRSARLRFWAVERPERPRWLQALVGFAKRPVSRRVAAALEPDAVPVADHGWCAEGAALEPLCAGPEWHWQSDLPVVLCQTAGSFRLLRLVPGASLLSLDIEPPDGDGLLAVSLERDGELLERFVVAGRQVCEVVLPDVGHLGATPETFTIQVAEPASRRWRKTCGRLCLHAVGVGPAPPLSTGAVLPFGRHRPFSEIASLVAERNAAARDGDVPETRLLLPVAQPPSDRAAALSLILGPDQRRGWLDVWQGERLAWSGSVGPGCGVLVPVAAHPRPPDEEILLSLLLRDDEPLADAPLSIAALGWAEAAVGPGGEALLVPGEFRAAGVGDGLKPLLGEGWTVPDDGFPVLSGLAATLRFALAARADGTDPVVLVGLEPLAAAPDGYHLIVGLSAAGGPASLCRLVGWDQIALPLRGMAATGGNPVEITLHAALRAELAETPALEAHGGVRLTAVTVGHAEGPAFPATRPVAPDAPDVDALALLAEAAQVSGTDDVSALGGLRDRLAAALSDVAARAIPSILTPAALRACAALGARLEPLGEAATVPEGGAAADWLRYLARAALGGPAAQSCAGLSFGHLPPMSREMARLIGGWLASDPRQTADAASIDRHRDLLLRLLPEARAAVTGLDEAHPRRLAAEAFIENVRPSCLLRADAPIGDVVRAFGAALEALLLVRGNELRMVPGPRADGLPRVGFLVRAGDDPAEARILNAMLDLLPAGEFEVTVFSAEGALPDGTDPRARPAVALAGIPLSHAVAAIRARDLDVMILGSFVLGFDRFAQIAAHTLARRQIAMSALSPVTTGLSATDVFVLGDSAAPAGCEADFSEPCERAPGAGRIFPEMVQAPNCDRAVDRARLGIAADAAVFMTGAPLEEIDDSLLGLWMRILARCAGSVLVVGTFAPGLASLPDRRRFSGRVETMAARLGVAGDRIVSPASLPQFDFARVLALADVFLDSFPSSGAPATVEALSAGVPVIARAAQDRRCHQAAGWLAEFGLPSLIAPDDDGYVDLAVRVASDPAFRASALAEIGRNRTAALRQDAFRSWFPACLRRGVAPDAPTPRYLFHHMPKAGGISTRKMFEDWFHVVRDYREPWGPDDPPPLDLSTLGPDDLLTGHYATDGVPLAARYPETADPLRWRRITFVRDPLELALSFYFFERVTRPASDPEFRPKTLGRFLREYDGLYLRHFECDRANWREVLGRYWFIGTLERMPDCMAWLAGALGKPPLDAIRHDHATPRSEAADPADLAVFIRNMAHEFEIYRWVCDRLEERLNDV